MIRIDSDKRTYGRAWLLAGLLGLALAAPAAAQKAWRHASSAGGQRAFIDTASIVRSGDKVEYWRELRASQPTVLSDGTRYDVIGTRIEIDCRAMTLRALENYASYEGSEIARFEREEAIEPIAAGTTAAVEARAVCDGEWSS